MFRFFLLFVFYSVRVAAENLPDPTQPDGWAQTTDSGEIKEWKLSSILVSKHRKIAVVNGSVVKEGDALGDGHVTLISRKKVIVDTNTGPITLQLTDSQIRK